MVKSKLEEADRNDHNRHRVRKDAYELRMKKSLVQMVEAWVREKVVMILTNAVKEYKKYLEQDI